MEIKWNLNEKHKLIQNLTYIWKGPNLNLVSIFLFLIISLVQLDSLFAQEEEDMLEARRTDLYYGWNNEYEVGAQFMVLGFTNPPAGKGGGQITAGLNLRASLIKNDIYHIWENEGFLNLNFQRKGDEIIDYLDFAEELSGAGTTPFQEAPWTKNQDQFRVSSKYSWRTNSDSRIYYSGFTKLRTQVLNSWGADEDRNYIGSYPVNYGENLTKNSAFMAPGIWTTGLGLEYRDKYNQYSIFYSPATYKAIIVLDQEVASSAVFSEVSDTLPTGEIRITKNHLGSLQGNDQDYDNVNDELSFYKINHQVGSQLLARYEGDIIPEKLTVTSNLDVFIDYLNPSGLEFDVNLTLDLFHDKDVPLLHIDDGIETLKYEGVFLTHRFSISYNDTF